METFTIGLGTRWWFRVFDGNPLVRRSDRVEAMVVVLAVLITVVAIPMAGAFGTSVHEERTRLYIDEARTRHQVVATATEEGQIFVQGRSIVFTAEAGWTEAGKPHRGVVMWPNDVKVGDRQSVWVNDRGEIAGQPSPSSKAGVEAVSAAFALWLAVAQAAAVLVFLVRHWLDRSRYAEWDREINESRNNDAGRNHRS